MHNFCRARSNFDFNDNKSKFSRYYNATRKYQYIAVLSATMGAFGSGCTLAWASPALPSMVRAEEGQVFVLNANERMLIISIPTLGAFFSGALTGFLITRLGRKTTLLLISAPFVFGWLLIAYAENLEMLYAGRFITGLCSGGFALAAPVFVSEIAEPSIRGKLVCVFQLMVTLGILFTYILGAFLTWQWLSIICGLVPLVFCILILFMPESPIHHLWVDEKTEALKSLCLLRGASSESDVEEEFFAMIEWVQEAKQKPIHLKDLKSLEAMRTTIISTSLTIFQQLSGINGLIFFSVSIFDRAEVGVNSQVGAIIVAFVQVCGTIAAALLVDKLGRRIMLLMSYMTMTVSVGLLGTFFYLNSKQIQIINDIGWFPLAMLMVYIIAFSLGAGPVPWVIMGEIIPLRLTGLGTSIATSCNWLLAFLVTFFFEPLQNVIGIAWCYWMFCIICILATIHVFLVVTETKGKSLSEIQKMFSENRIQTRTRSVEVIRDFVK